MLAYASFSIPFFIRPLGGVVFSHIGDRVGLTRERVRQIECDTLKCINEAISSQDLDISKDGGDLVIAFAYPKKVKLFGNVSLLFEFEGSSKK